MKKIILFVIIMVWVLGFWVNNVWAFPKKGVHLLFPEEIQELSVSSKKLSPGDFVIVPIGYQDWQHLDKWQKFMHQVGKMHLVPILRLTTQPLSGGYWQKPDLISAIDWANFLSLLDWPKGDRWIIVFNEPNHAQEWGGVVNPHQYSRILAEYSLKLHTKDENFKVLPAALDMAAGRTSTTWPAKKYWLVVWHDLPDFYNLVDGWNSHAYPNPGFSARPNKHKLNNVASYNFELGWFKEYFHQSWQKNIFITETGWSSSHLKREKICDYLKYSWQNIWFPDKQLKLVSLFLLKGQPGPFSGFSLLVDDKPTMVFNCWRDL